MQPLRETSIGNHGRECGRSLSRTTIWTRMVDRISRFPYSLVMLEDVSHVVRWSRIIRVQTGLFQRWSLSLKDWRSTTETLLQTLVSTLKHRRNSFSMKNLSHLSGPSIQPLMLLQIRLHLPIFRYFMQNLFGKSDQHHSASWILLISCFSAAVRELANLHTIGINWNH